MQKFEAISFKQSFENFKEVRKAAKPLSKSQIQI
jgi:hypothetical protein